MRRYRIVVEGEIGELVSKAFSDCLIETGDGQTVLTADIGDESDLYRLLDRLRDFAIELVSFREVTATGP